MDRKQQTFTFPFNNRNQFDGKFPFYREPRELGTFSLDGDRNFCNDQRNLKFLIRPNGKINFNLSSGYNRAIHRTFENEKLKSILQWMECNFSLILQKDASNHFSLNTDFVCYRGLMTKLLCTPYENREGWIICATKFRNTIYLCAFETEDDIRRRSNMTERENLMTSWGYKFESYLTSTSPNGSSNSEEPVNENEEFCSVYRTRLNTNSLICGAEIDGIDPMASSVESHSYAKYVELKTSRIIDNGRQEQNFKKFKLIKWWAQSFLIGIPKIICGFRDDDGFVRYLEDYKTVEIGRIVNNAWDPAICFNFCDQFLQFVKQSVTIDDPRVVYKFEWYPKQDIQGYFLNRSSYFQILPEWYIQKFTSFNN